jgi:hypothetical protein
MSRIRLIGMINAEKYKLLFNPCHSRSTTETTMPSKPDVNPARVHRLVGRIKQLFIKLIHAIEGHSIDGSEIIYKHTTKTKDFFLDHVICKRKCHCGETFYDIGFEYRDLEFYNHPPNARDQGADK